MVETDCPYLSPAPWRGKRNEPAHVVATADALAALLGPPRKGRPRETPGRYSPFGLTAMHETDSRSDEALVEGTNHGEQTASEALYRRYAGWVYRLAWRFTGDRDLALDVRQETFLYLFAKSPRLVLTARMTTFLYPVVRNLAVAARRKQRRYASDEQVILGLPRAAGDRDYFPRRAGPGALGRSRIPARSPPDALCG